MNIRPLTIDEFNAFVKNHPLRSYYQSLNYAKLQAEQGYEYEFIGYCENSSILAASLILYKKIKNTYYGYAPRGFLIDYTNLFFLKNFTLQLTAYYKKRNFAFIKINPEIAIASLNPQTKNFEYNSNYGIIENLLKCGYKKLKSNLNFETLLPRFTAILPFANFSLANVTKNTRNKIKKGIRKGLKLEPADKFGIELFYNLVADKVDKDRFYYNDKFNIFNQEDAIDLFLVSIDYKEFLLNSQALYEQELLKNNELAEKISAKNESNRINKKMNSDKQLLILKNEIAEASKKINDNSLKEYIAAATVIKYDNRIKIDVTGFNPQYKKFAPNYFLHYAILEYYKNDYKYAELNGVSGNLAKDSEYYGLTRFKMGFKPTIYEYIGEFDLPIDNLKYQLLLKSGALAKEFDKE